MKKISDYRDEEALELWADIMETASAIVADPELKKIIDSKKPKIMLAHYILKNHKEEAKEILLRIDPTPINGLNFLTRILSVVSEIGDSEELADFF